MSRLRCPLAVLPFSVSAGTLLAQTTIGATFARDPRQPIDQSYTDHIKQYTTQPYFNSPAH